MEPSSQKSGTTLDDVIDRTLDVLSDPLKYSEGYVASYVLMFDCLNAYGFIEDAPVESYKEALAL